MTPARTVAAGALAGGMLLLSAFLPAHALDGARDAGKDQAHQTRAAKEATPRRKPLKAASKRECTRIGAAIRDNEDTERRSGARGVMESLEQDAQSLRKRYRELGC